MTSVWEPKKFRGQETDNEELGDFERTAWKILATQGRREDKKRMASWPELHRPARVQGKIQVPEGIIRQGVRTAGATRQ